MVVESDTGRCANEDAEPRRGVDIGRCVSEDIGPEEGVDCEILHRLEKETKHSL